MGDETWSGECWIIILICSRLKFIFLEFDHHYENDVIIKFKMYIDWCVNFCVIFFM